MVGRRSCGSSPGTNCAPKNRSMFQDAPAHMGRQSTTAACPGYEGAERSPLDCGERVNRSMALMCPSPSLGICLQAVSISGTLKRKLSASFLETAIGCFDRMPSMVEPARPNVNSTEHATKLRTDALV